MIMNVIIEIIRPKQWYKNLLIFVPLVFSLHLFNVNLVPSVLLGFVALCLNFGSSYVINDLIDYKKDILHPEKSKRPLPSGRISRKQAITYALFLIVISEFLSYLLGIPFLIINSSMFILTLIYSLRAKDIFLVDVFLISINYILRAVSGAFLLNVKISPWLIMGVFFLALLLSLGKRKNEISFLKDKAIEHRKILNEYSSGILDYAIGVTSATLILSYSIYSMTGPTSVNDWRLVLTIPIAFFILILYINRMYNGGYGGKELNDLLVADKKLIIAIVMFIAAVIFLLYFIPQSYFK